jgi:tryptophan halogenase
VPDSLRYKMDHFRAYGRLVSARLELFLNPSWLAVLIGQGVMPERYDPLVDQRPQVDAAARLAGLRRAVAEAAEAMPRHSDFVARYCPAPAGGGA